MPSPPPDPPPPSTSTPDPSTNTSMPISPHRAHELHTNLSQILNRITSTSTHSHTPPPRLVAVSKLKPANDILALHQAPSSHLHFGENYFQELLTKSQLLPREIRWHFIGALQTNKTRPLADQVPNLWCVESVDSIKKAEGLEKGRAALCTREPNYENIPLRVFVQVNTSGEQEKAGAEPAGDAVTELCRVVRDKCPHLKLQGLMTIGAIARSQAAKEGDENEDFVTLREVRGRVARELGLEKEEELELSMGMSEDFESAIRCGSSEVRVGSTIFGQRPAKQDAMITEDG